MEGQEPMNTRVYRRSGLMRQLWRVIAWLPLWSLTPWVAPPTEAPTANPVRAAVDRILTPGDI
jgi:hypothetical protein